MALHHRFKQFTECTSPINYKNVALLKPFLTESGRILPRQITRMNAKQHRELTKAIKRARHIGLLPFGKVRALRSHDWDSTKLLFP